MADVAIRKTDSHNGAVRTGRMRDLGNGIWAESIVDEGVPSNGVTVTQYSDTIIGTLVSTVNAYLASSAKRCISVTFSLGGIASIIFYAVVIETT